MASDAVPGSIPVGLVHGSQAPKSTTVPSVGGTSLPRGGKAAAVLAVGGNAQNATAGNKAGIQALVAQLNKYLNDSGRPAQFRVDPESRGKTIQEVNPATGDVIGEFSAEEFPELARSVGVSGVVVNSRA